MYGEVKNGLAVSLEEEDLPGVLGAICFAAPGAVGKHSNAEASPCANN